MLSLFSSDVFGDAATQVGSQAQIFAKDAALFDDVGDKLALTGLKVCGFWVGVAEKVAPVLKPLLDKFASLDLASWGQKSGEAVAFIVQAFADGKVGDILFTSAKIAFANAVNFLAETMDFKNPDAPAVSAPTALRATDRVPDIVRHRLRARFQPARLLGSWWVEPPASAAQPAHEALCDDEIEARSDLVIVEAEVPQRGHRAGGVARVQRAKKHVAAFRRIKRRADGSRVTHCAHQDDIGVEPQQTLHALGKCESLARVDLELCDTIEDVFDRIFDAHDRAVRAL